MNKLIKCSIILLFCTVNAVYGQTPNSVTIDGKDYYQHGYNSSGGPGLQQEVRDSVTVTSVMKYFVLPDPQVSPDYKYDTPANTVDFSDVNSTFTWSLVNSLGTTDNSTTPIVTITWGNTGIDGVKVTEVPNVSAACADDGTTIPVAVIIKPEIAFVPNGAVYADSACHEMADVLLGIEIPFDMSVTTQSSQVWVDYTVTKDGTAYATLTGTDVPVIGNEITLEFTEYGRYEVTITKVTDRVSRKSNVLGDIPTVSSKFAYHVMLPAQTGPVYHIPNNY